MPNKLSRRQATSKLAAFYDLMGKFAPLLAGLKADLREVVKNTSGWDDPMPPQMRSKWFENFWLPEKL